MKVNTINPVNPHLAKKQKLTETEINGLKDLHSYRLELFERFETVKDLTKIEIQELVLELEDLEYNMQWVWKFNQDKLFHTWWHEVPNCSCKSYLNRFGKPRIVDPGCMIHCV